MLNGFKSSSVLARPGKSKPLRAPTKIDDLYTSDADYNIKIDSIREQLSRRQELLYADGRHGVVVIFQGMDTSGKDGAIKHIMYGLDPQGVTVATFKAPSENERRQDFLLRAHVVCPPRGKIGIFNRSHYEEVVTVRVHPEFLEAQKLPPYSSVKKLISERYDDIVNFESYLARQGYVVIKFFLHLSRTEQRKRLIARIDEPRKNWKFDSADMSARAEWTAYQTAYANCISATSTKHAPWFVIPADDKKNARLIMSQILLEALEKLPLQTPKLSIQQKKVLQTMRAKLVRD